MTPARARRLRPCQVMLDGKRRRAQRIEVDGKVMVLHPDQDANFAAGMVEKINSGEVTVEITKIGAEA